MLCKLALRKVVIFALTPIFFSIPFSLLQAKSNEDARSWQQTEITSLHITRAISKGLGWLRSQQKDGAWDPDLGPIPTALAVMAFLYLNPDESNAVIRDGINYLFNDKYQPFNQDDPYNLSMEVLTLTATGNKSKYYNNVAKTVKRLLEYDLSNNSLVNELNVQSFMFALFAAQLWEIDIGADNWVKINKWLVDNHREDGGWADDGTDKSDGAITAAAIIGLKASGLTIQDLHVQKGIEWLARNFSVERNPGSSHWHFHYLVALQRAMMIPPEQELLGDHNWYEQGAKYLISSQRSDGSWHLDAPKDVTKQKLTQPTAEYCDVATTSLALMFLVNKIPTKPLPDLSGSDIQPVIFSKIDPQSGDRVEVKATVANVDEVDTESVDVKFFDGDPESGGMQIGPLQVTQPLKSGEKCLVSALWTASNIGVHRIYIIIDSEDSIKESNESNNVIYSDIQVAGDIDKVSKKEPPSAIKIADNIYKIGNITVDIDKPEISMPGKVNMQTGLIEYLACAPGGKLHESLLVLDVDPIHLHVALILLGLEPRGDFKFQGDPGEPKGDPVDILVQWNESEPMTEVRAEKLILKTRKSEPMEYTHWIFTGSMIHNNIYLAALEGSLIATYHDPAAIINNPLPEGADDTVYNANFDVVPKVGTPIAVIIRPSKKEDGK